MGVWVGFRGVSVAKILADAATCWKRISHPMWNEGLLTAAEAGQNIQWHPTACAYVVVVCVVHACTQSLPAES